MSAFAHFVAQQLEQPAAPIQTDGRRRKEPVPYAGDLAAATLKLIRSKPNQDVREIASLLEVQPPQLYGVLQRLKRRNLIAAEARFGAPNLWKAVP